MKPEYSNNLIVGPSLEVFRNELLDLEWETKRTARHEYFMSEGDSISYSYGRIDDDIKYKSKPFSRLVGHLKDGLNVDGGFNYNGCFLNKYDDEKQHLGWHSDDFEGMDPDHPIAVVSFGAEREIWVKPKGEKGVVPEEDRYLLKEGSLFVMPKGFQNTHFHRIPKHPQPCGWRISLTFRSFLQI